MPSNSALDKEAFLSLIQNHGPELLNRAEGMLGNTNDAHICVQECYVLAGKNIHIFHKEEDLCKQMYVLLMECCLDKMKKKIAIEKQSIEELLPQFDGDGCRIEPLWSKMPSADEVLALPDARKNIMNALEKLPETYRYVFYLRDIEELTISDISEKLSLSDDATSYILHSARSMLKKLIEPMMLGENINTQL